MREMFKFIGEKGFLVVDGLEIQVIVKDVRSNYGQMNFLVTPVAGKREKWVMADRVNFIHVEGNK